MARRIYLFSILVAMFFWASVVQASPFFKCELLLTIRTNDLKLPLKVNSVSKTSPGSFNLELLLDDDGRVHVFVPQDLYDVAVAKTAVDSFPGLYSILNATPDLLAKTLGMTNEQYSAALAELTKTFKNVLPKHLTEPLATNPRKTGALADLGTLKKVKKELEQKLQGIPGYKFLGIGSVGGGIGIRIYIAKDASRENFEAVLAGIGVPFEFVVNAGEIVAQAPVKYTVTPHQVEGPFYPGYKLFANQGNDLTNGMQAKGETVVITGKLLHKDGTPIAGAELHLWQTDGLAGKYRHPADPEHHLVDPKFNSWGGVITAADGSYQFRTVRPIAYPAGENWMRPDHLHFAVFVNGRRMLITQAYFTGDQWLHQDHIFQALNEEQKQALLIPLQANQEVNWDQKEGPKKVSVGTFNIVLDTKKSSK